MIVSGLALAVAFAVPTLARVERLHGSAIATVFDQRDLTLTVTRGADTPDASTSQVDYDRNGNRARVTDAEDTDGDGAPESVTFAYDGFDRAVEVIDPLGDRSITAYDVASNVLRRQVLGHPANLPRGPPVPLSDERYSHDELGRVFRTDAALFLAGGFSPVRPADLRDQDGDGFVTARMEYDALSRLTFAIEDDLQATETVYDGASRAIEAIDALGNRVVTAYDQSSNAVRVSSLERSAGGLVPDETFITQYVFDQLDRLVRATDNAGQTARFAYDSRDNLVSRSDAEGPLAIDPLGLFPEPGQSGAINQPGNTRTYVWTSLYSGTERDRVRAEASRWISREPTVKCGRTTHPRTRLASLRKRCRMPYSDSLG